ASTLQFSEITVDPGTSSVSLRAKIPNPDGDLLPGMFVQAQLNEGIRNDALLVPQQAVTRDQKGDAFVWVMGEDKKVERRPIVTLRTVGNQWLIGDGLQSGEQVVTEGVQRMRSGIELFPAPAGNVSVVSYFAPSETSTPEIAAKQNPPAQSINPSETKA